MVAQKLLKGIQLVLIGNVSVLIILFDRLDVDFEHICWDFDKEKKKNDGTRHMTQIPDSYRLMYESFLIPPLLHNAPAIFFSGSHYIILNPQSITYTNHGRFLIISIKVPEQTIH